MVNACGKGVPLWSVSIRSPLLSTSTQKVIFVFCQEAVTHTRAIVTHGLPGVLYSLRSCPSLPA